MAFTHKLFTSYQKVSDGDTRIGELNRIWYDSNTNTFRIQLDDIPGGTIIGGSGGGGSYTLPTASPTVKGGVKIGANITITNGVISVAAPFSGSYVDLTNKPILVTSYNQLTDKPSLFSGSYLDLTNKPTLFSGSYTDLTNKPTIPQLPANAVGYLHNDGSGTLTWGTVSGGGGGASVTESATPPSSPNAGDLWWDTVSGDLFIYYDGNWVPSVTTTIGPKGDTGAQGPQGATGDPGPTGPKGDPGNRGLQGVKGDTGATGPKGDKGDTGDQGVSVTLKGTKATIADLPVSGNPGDAWIVTHGDGGSHLDGSLWFWSTVDNAWDDIGKIVGPQGDPGPTGPQGDPGPTGSTGPKGDTGSTGPKGDTGASIAEGATPPSSPIAGDLWWDTVSGNLFIYYDSTWVLSMSYTSPVNADWNATTGLARILNKPTIFDGNYNHLTNKPTLFSGSYTDLSNKPVLFSGSYADLTNKPTLVTSYNQLTDKPSLFSGSYTDLSNKPALFSGSYADLTNKPFIPDSQIQSDWNQTNNSALDYIKNKPTLFDGNYNHLTNKPTLFSGSYDDLTNKPTLVTSYNQLTDKPTIPTSFDRIVSPNGTYSTILNNSGVLTVPGNVIPPTSGVYTLGDSTHKFADVWIGPNTLNIEDQVTNVNAALTVSNGALFIDGAEIIRLGDMQLKAVGLTFPDGSTQTTAATTYTLPTASTSIKGGVKIDGSTITINNGVISAQSARVTEGDTPPGSPSAGDLWWDAVSGNMFIYYDSTWVLASTSSSPVNADWNATSGPAQILNKPDPYALPTASTSVKGGVKIDGTTIAINNGVISVGPALTSATQFKGVWDASTNTPALSSNQVGAAAGWEYIVGATGTRDLGNGTVTYNTGDIVIYDGTNWNDIPGTASTVSAFNGRTGIVTLESTDVTTALGYTPSAQIKMTFSYSDLPTSPIGTVPAGCIIKEVCIILLTAFDATSTLSVGSTANHTELLDTTDIITRATGTFTTEPAHKYTNNTELVLSITAGASTQGNGIVIVYYE